jgi:hypothetical protein
MILPILVSPPKFTSAASTSLSPGIPLTNSK